MVRQPPNDRFGPEILIQVVGDVDVNQPRGHVAKNDRAVQDELRTGARHADRAAHDQGQE